LKRKSRFAGDSPGKKHFVGGEWLTRAQQLRRKGFHIPRQEHEKINPKTKNLVVFRDDDGNVLSHAWMTRDEYLKMKVVNK
jgi:hypothetical protein